MFEDIQSFFTTRPKRPTSSLGAGASAEDDPAMPAFQKAWKDGALVEDLFGPSPFALHGTVGHSGADNFRPDVAKVETLLGDAGYYKPLTNDGPSGWHNGNLDQAIRTFQKDKGLEVDGFLKPNGPTIGKIGSLLGGAEPQQSPSGEERPTAPWVPERPPASHPMPKPPVGEPGPKPGDIWDLLQSPNGNGGKTATQNKAKPVSGGAGEKDGQPASQGGANQQQDDVARLFGMPLQNEEDVRKETRQTLEKLRDRGKALGQDKASELLDHYLNGDGSPVTLDKDWVRGHEPIKKAEAKVQGHFENWLTGKGPKDSQHGTISGNIPRDGESVEIKNMKWESSADNSVWRFADDRSNTLGGLGVKGLGDLKLERRGDEVLVTGTVRQNAGDRYDFAKGRTEEEQKKYAS